MARPLLGLDCPVCRRTGTSKQIRRANSQRLERYYECSECFAEFTTVEQIVRAPLDSVMVRVPATVDNPEPVIRPYRAEAIDKHLRSILKKVLIQVRRRELVNLIDSSLANGLGKLERSEESGPDSIVVSAAEIREVIEACLKTEAQIAEGTLRDHYQTAHALYAMTARHRTVSDVLQFLEENYPEWITSAIPESVGLPEPQHWHYPQQVLAPRPSLVVKNFRPGDQPTLPADYTAPIRARVGPESMDDEIEGLGDGDADWRTSRPWNEEDPASDLAALRERRPRVPFQVGRFDASIKSALVAEPPGAAMTTQQTVANIREWVLWDLAGQDVVRSSQLSTLTAAVLRRLSPLAYLRWVTLGKELSVSEIYSEGCALLSSPSLPLVFDNSHALSPVPAGTPPASTR